MSLVVSTTISQLAVELLARSIVLPQTVSRVPGQDYSGSGGQTLVRVPQRLTANQQETRGAPIEYDEIDELSVPVALSHWYSAVKVSDEELTLDVVDFGRQVLAPMIAAIAEAGEDRLAGVINGVSPSASFATTEDPEDTKAVIIEAREELMGNNVPAGARYLAVSPSVASRLFKVEEFVRVDASGSPSALRDAVIGAIYGLTVVESNALAPDTAAVYHSSAFVHATLAPAIPDGAASASASTVQGIALRTLRDFDPGVLSDIVAVSTFGGAALVDADRVVKLGISGS